jgi:hypothetical protein
MHFGSFIMIRLNAPREWAKHTVISHLFIINAKLNAVDEILRGWRDFEATIG